MGRSGYGIAVVPALSGGGWSRVPSFAQGPVVAMLSSAHSDVTGDRAAIVVVVGA